MFLVNRLLRLTIIITASLNIALAAENSSILNNPIDDNKHELITSIYASLYSAIKMDSADEGKQFISFGADINYRYEDGKTPLMLASSMGSTRSVLSLIELGANPNLTSKQGMTALDYARNVNNQSIIAILQTDKPQAPSLSTENQLITTIQFYLNRLGYIAGDVDGVYGSKTKNSLKQFAIDFSQPYRVEISDRQVETLFNAMTGAKSEITPDAIEARTHEENDLIETVPTELVEELSSSEKEALNLTR